MSARLREQEVRWAFDSEACHNLDLASGQKQAKLCVFICVSGRKKKRERERKNSADKVLKARG